MIEPKIVVIEGYSFIIHFEKDSQMRWFGQVTEIEIFDGGKWLYRSNESSELVEELQDARVWFEWSFCWRGVWEGRVYFKDEEYWGEEMETIPLLWKEVEEIVKSQIKEDNPDYKHFEK